MTYYIVGTGNTAWFLATRLYKAGFTCKGVYGRDEEHARRLAGAVHATVIDNPGDIQDDADCCILAISDHAIAAMAAHFAFEHTTLIHTAGSVNRSILAPNAKHTGVLWPIYSLIKENLPLHREVPITIKGGTDRAGEVLQKLAGAITDIYYTVSWEQRQWLHLCAVLCNNFTNHLMAVSEEICDKQRIPFSLLYPIVSQTAERIRQASPRHLQTGPARRGDEETIDKHREMLAYDKELENLYSAITNSIEKMYRADKEE